MLKHVVFFKFKKGTPDGSIAEIEKGLKGLPSIIAEIKSFEVGRDVVHSERSYDLAIISSFDDLEAMKRYQVHPAHQAVVAKSKPVAESIVAVDFES